MNFNFKPSTVYPLALVVIVVILVFMVVSKNTPPAPDKPPVTQGQMPNDDIHKGLGGSPSGTNVADEVKHQIDMLGKAVQKNPNDTVKLREFADILVQSHKQDLAIPLYEKILKINPKRKDILIALSYVAYIKQDFDKSAEYTKRILKFLPKDPEALYNLGAIAAIKGNNAEAKKIWADVAKNNPGTPIAATANESIQKLESSGNPR